MGNEEWRAMEKEKKKTVYIRIDMKGKEEKRKDVLKRKGKGDCKRKEVGGNVGEEGNKKKWKRKKRKG